MLSEIFDAMIVFFFFFHKKLAFHEDPILYKELKRWMKEQGIQTLIADGEGVVAASQLVQWSLEGAIDCVQYSAREKGFSFWLALAPTLREKGLCLVLCSTSSRINQRSKAFHLLPTTLALALAVTPPCIWLRL